MLQSDRTLLLCTTIFKFTFLSTCVHCGDKVRCFIMVPWLHLNTADKTGDVTSYFCQTHTPGQTWELTLLSCGNKKKKKKKNNNNPHPNSTRRGCSRVLTFCMLPSVTKRIGLHPKQNNSDTPALPPL